VTAVCHTSGVTSRYFYQHFSDRDALLRAVFERLNATMQDVLLRALPRNDTTARSLAEAPMRALVSMIEDDPVLARILFVESGTEPTLRELRSEFMGSLADLTLEVARRHLNISDSAITVTHLAATIGVGGLFEVLRRWLAGELDFTGDQLVDHCAGFLASLAAYVLSTDTQT
jgi:AcrR family transcriptional regulator